MRIRQVSTATAFVLCLIVVSLSALAQPGRNSHPKGYSFRPIAKLGDNAPGGDTFWNDFEPYGLQNNGVIAFVADLNSAGDAEGLFEVRHGLISEIARAGQPAPGGGTFFPFDLGRVGLNAGGDLVFGFFDPNALPFGFNASVYRFSHDSQVLSAVAKPGDPAPGAGMFVGTNSNFSINNHGEIIFSGIVTDGDIAPGPPGVDGSGLGTWLFRADKHGNISSVVRPGDLAPDGRPFDWAANGWINDRGDIAFGAHVKGDDCVDLGFQQSDRIFCADSVYLKDADTDEIQSIAHQGQPAPGGETFNFAFGPMVNNAGDIVFIGDLTKQLGLHGLPKTLGVFLYSDGKTIAVARPGDSMPGGGNFLSASDFVSTYHLNNQGEVSFSALLDTVSDTVNGFHDTGVYVYSKGHVRLVARTGSVIPGVGTIAYVGSFVPLVPTTPPVPAISNTAGGIIDEEGQVLFSATMVDGKVFLLTATPRHNRELREEDEDDDN